MTVAEGADRVCLAPMTDSPHSERSPDWHWSNYWQQGLLTTFSMGKFQAGYDGPVAVFWHSVFDPLPEDAALVDLATGNGAIPLLAVRRARELGRRWRIIGIDYADIRLPQSGEDIERVRQDMAEVRLIPRTPMEATGLDDGSVDLVTSHFGLEYGDLDQALAEIARILARPGRLALIMHHPDSAVVRQARHDFQVTRWCLEEERFDRKVAELARITASASTPEQRRRLKYNPEAERWRRQVNRSIDRLTRRLQGQDPTQMLKITQTFLSIFSELKDHSREDKLRFIADFSEAMSAYGARMESMARATLDEQQFTDFLAMLERQGFGAVKSEVIRYDNGDLIGRTVTASLD